MVEKSTPEFDRTPVWYSILRKCQFQERCAQAAQRPSSPAAGSAESEVRNERSERSCRRSGAAPCCAAVMTFGPPLPHTQSTLTSAKTYQPPKPKSCTKAETYQLPKTKSHSRAETPRHRKPKAPHKSRQVTAAEAPTRVLASNAAKHQRPEYSRRTITIRQAQQHND